ncbi:MAG: hypothetical protein V4735_07355 [Pseudomonadota bacterium]
MLLLTGSAASASDGFSVPVEAKLRLSRSRAAIGQTIIATLRLRTLEAMPTAKFSIKAPTGCAEQVTPLTPENLSNIPKDARIKVKARFKVMTASPCYIGAEVVSFESADARSGAVFGATLNAAPPAPPPKQLYGVTSRGDPTIDALVGGD